MAFFSISGYVVSSFFYNKNFNLKQVLIFYKKRFWRIYPLFFLISILFICYKILKTDNFIFDKSYFFNNFFFLQFNHDYDYGVFWTLGIEAQFYLFAPFFVLFLMKIKNKYSLIFFIYFLLSFMDLFFYKKLGFSLDGRNLISNLSHFYLGVVAFLWKDDFKLNLSLRHLILISFGLLILSNFIYHNFNPFYFVLCKYIIDIIFLILIIISIKFSEFNFKKNIIISFIHLTGLISFGIYAWYEFIIILLPAKYYNFYIIYILTWVISYFSFYYFENKLAIFSPYQFTKRIKNS